MKRCIVGVVVTAFMTTGLVTTAPPAVAGCHYGGQFLSKCDGPVQPDGSWERCVGVAQLVPRGFSSYLTPVKHCVPMGPGHPVADPAVADPPWRIGD
ncbi:hypothetical protein [Mycobacterium sp. SMC-4]|uniref:CDGP domain-containing protein n=1 Tax=Mycobacterium sp. SMC-4 TaxID=2857059 RepID=UPI0021B4CEEB|nr:hypothetical protein [Mycobacterium sp. SMC-4]UXA19061.1 hypothetical protein KXD98_05220 [Mycobacterium sp. SMC-4]